MGVAGRANPTSSLRSRRCLRMRPSPSLNARHPPPLPLLLPRPGRSSRAPTAAYSGDLAGPSLSASPLSCS
uniref:Uncharacterized protein n=1 Tax=Setaria italica TaxID=4555 RepID=K3YZ98_SETIT